MDKLALGRVLTDKGEDRPSRHWQGGLGQNRATRFHNADENGERRATTSRGDTRMQSNVNDLALQPAFFSFDEQFQARKQLQMLENNTKASIVDSDSFPDDIQTRIGFSNKLVAD